MLSYPVLMDLASQRDEELAARSRLRRAAGAPAGDPPVTLRPLEPGDGPALLEIFAGLGPRSRLLRFLTPKVRLTDSELRYFTRVDQQDHVAILAISSYDDRPVGVGRFVRAADDPASADIALAVVDRWQDHGVGTLLATALFRRATEVGVRRFTLVTAHDNDAVHRLLRRNQVDVERLDCDRETVELAVDLPTEPVAARVG